MSTSIGSITGLFSRKVEEGIQKFPKGSIWQTALLSLPFTVFVAASVWTMSELPILTRFFWFGVGVMSWTFLEYLLHRFVLHYEPKSPVTRAVLNRLHIFHHHYPKDQSQVCIPFVLQLPVWSLLYLASVAVGAHAEKALMFMSALATAMVMYDIVHFAVHYAEADSGFFQTMKRQHMRHHFADHNRRFGVTTPLWDIVFGTYSDSSVSDRGERKPSHLDPK